MGLNEKRRFTRAAVAFPVAVSDRSGHELTAQAVDISADGIGIHSEQDLLTDTRFMVQLPFEWGPTFVIARIVRREGSVYGCQFMDLTPQEADSLEALVRSSLQQKLLKVTALSYRVGPFERVSLLTIILTCIMAAILLAAALFAPFKQYFVPLAAVCAAIFILLLLTSFSCADDAGWQLLDDSLQIKGGQYSETIKLSTLRAALVDFQSEWEPKFRKTEYGIQELSDGVVTDLCHLKNNHEAIVFRYQGASKALLLKAKFRYFLIIHPGVEQLYDELVKRGISKIINP